MISFPCSSFSVFIPESSNFTIGNVTRVANIDKPLATNGNIMKPIAYPSSNPASTVAR